MAEAQAYRKNAGPVQALQPTGASTIVSQQDKINSAPVKFDKFPEFCDACEEPLAHADLIGKYSRTVFEVRGYKCPACGYKVGKLFSKNFRDSTVRFDWKRLGLQKSGKVSNSIGGQNDQQCT